MSPTHSDTEQHRVGTVAERDAAHTLLTAAVDRSQAYENKQLSEADYTWEAALDLIVQLRRVVTAARAHREGVMHRADLTSGYGALVVALDDLDVFFPEDAAEMKLDARDRNLR